MLLDSSKTSYMVELELNRQARGGCFFLETAGFLLRFSLDVKHRDGKYLINGYGEVWKTSLIFVSKDNPIIGLVSFNTTFPQLNYCVCYVDQLRGNGYTKTSLRFVFSLKVV